MTSRTMVIAVFTVFFALVLVALVALIVCFIGILGSVIPTLIVIAAFLAGGYIIASRVIDIRKNREEESEDEHSTENN